RGFETLQSNEKAVAAAIVAIAFAALATPALEVATASTTAAPAAQTIMITLYASMANPSGWGLGPVNITNPGPTLTVNQGDTIMFHLFSADGATPMLVIDLDGSGSRRSKRTQRERQSCRAKPPPIGPLKFPRPPDNL